MKVFNIILSVLVLLFAIALAVTSFFLYEKRVQLLEGWGKFGEKSHEVATIMDKDSGTQIAEKVTTETLHHTQYANMDSVLSELTGGAEQLMKQRSEYIDALTRIAKNIEMRGVPSESKLTAVETSLASSESIVKAVVEMKNRRDNLVNGIASTASLVGVTVNKNAMRNDNDPSKALSALNAKLKSMNEQLTRYQNMARELAQASGSGNVSVNDANAIANATRTLKATISKLKTDLDNTRRELQKAKQEIERLNSTVANRQADITRLNQNLEASNNENNLLKSIITIDEDNLETPWTVGGVDARKAVKGKVIEINERFGFVVVDLGALTRVSQWLGNKNNLVDPKIEKGMKFNIVRNFDTPDVKLIVKGAEATNVADKCSIVEVPADDINNIKVGDTVIVDFVQ